MQSSAPSVSVYTVMSLVEFFSCCLVLTYQSVLVIADLIVVFFFHAEAGIRDAQESRGLGDVFK